MLITGESQITQLEEFEKGRDRVSGTLERIRAEISNIESGRALSELRDLEERHIRMLAVTTERLIAAGGIAEISTAAEVQLEFDFTPTPTVPYEPAPVRVEEAPMSQVLVSAGVA
jgi:hypothetical protein